MPGAGLLLHGVVRSLSGLEPVRVNRSPRQRVRARGPTVRSKPGSIPELL